MIAATDRYRRTGMSLGMGEAEQAPAGIDTTVASVARMYDYYLGGKDNFAVDREAAEKIIALVPTAREGARRNREFLGRAVRFAAESGIRQFLDIGAGLPTQQNVHQVALGVAPDSRVVYVDNDPIVLAHGRALLADNDNTTVVAGDLRDPDAILSDPQVTGHLDLSRPVAVLLVAILHFVPDDDKAAGIVARLRARLAPGSMLILTHIYNPGFDEATVRAGGEVYSGTSTGSLTARTPEHLAGYLSGMEIVEPGVVPVESWRPDYDPAIEAGPSGVLGAVGRMP
jgi:O-methyltransferase involved in polyketide biosynthesis